MKNSGKKEHTTKDLEKDLKYIKNEIIAKQPDGLYCKFSRILNAVSVYNITSNQYIGYWKKLYHKEIEKQNTIINACKEKLKKNTISKEKMIKLIKNSNDYEKEKKNAITALGGEYEIKKT